MDYPKFVVSNQKEESIKIIIQRVKYCIPSYKYTNLMSTLMGESSKFPKSWTLEIQIFNLQDV